MSRRLARAGTGAALLAATLTACTPDGTPRAAPSSPAPAAPTAAASTAPAYTATGLDLCAQTDRSPIDGLRLTLEASTPKPPATGPGAGCLFQLHTADGQPATLLVQAVTPTTVDDARRVYTAAGAVTEMTPDPAFAAVGEESAGLTQDRQLDFADSRYLGHARQANLEVEVGLAVGGRTFAPKETLATPVAAILRATLAKVPTA
jgi:hypothetical protein